MCLFACLCKSKWGVSRVAVLARKCVPPVVGAPNLQYPGGGGVCGCLQNRQLWNAGLASFLGLSGSVGPSLLYISDIRWFCSPCSFLTYSLFLCSCC